MDFAYVWFKVTFYGNFKFEANTTFSVFAYFDRFLRVYVHTVPVKIVFSTES